MTETSASSNVFQTKVALFNHSDYRGYSQRGRQLTNAADDADDVTVSECAIQEMLAAWLIG